MDSTSILVSQITLGAVSSWLLQVLKKASWFPILQEDSEKFIKVLWSIITSACAITGLSYTYDPTAHTLLITNFSFALVLHAGWSWLTQFVMQEGWYQVAFKPKAIASAVAVAMPAPVGATGSYAAAEMKKP